MIMKKYFKYFTTVVVLFALGAAFMANTHKTNTKAENPPPCWIEPTIQLTGDCVKYNENADYIVRMTITDICSNPNVILYGSIKEFLSDVSSTTFCVPNQLCTVDQAANCFAVTVTAVKKDNTTNTIICSGHGSVPTMNCEELMGFNGTQVPLN